MSHLEYTILLLTIATRETDTATWWILSTVVGFLVAVVLLALRMYSGKLDKANSRADKHEEDAQVARHQVVVNKIDAVHHEVHGFGLRLQRVESDVGELKQGHAEIKGRLGQHGSGERTRGQGGGR